MSQNPKRSLPIAFVVQPTLQNPNNLHLPSKITEKQQILNFKKLKQANIKFFFLRSDRND